MQAKHVPDRPVLEFLASNQGHWCFLGGTPDLLTAMPEGTPRKVALAKMRSLINRGLVSGCPCGCRGDFEITPKGLLAIRPERDLTDIVKEEKEC